jgi:hypothetical protein
MKFFSYILVFLFCLGVLGKTNLLTFIKKIKSPIELTSEADDDNKEADPEKNKDKERDVKEEREEDKNTFFFSNYIPFSFISNVSCNKHLLSLINIRFKSFSKEIDTPPPQKA